MRGTQRRRQRGRLTFIRCREGRIVIYQTNNPHSITNKFIVIYQNILPLRMCKYIYTCYTCVSAAIFKQNYSPISVVPPCWALTAILAKASLNNRDAAAVPEGIMKLKLADFYLIIHNFFYPY